MTKLAEAFAAFAKETGLPVGEPDEHGFWHLAYEGVHVAFAEFAEGKWIRAWARVGTCPTRSRTAIFERLLAYGHPSRIDAARSASFSMNNGDIFFQQVLPGWKLDLELVLLSLQEVADVTKRMREVLYDYPLREAALAGTEPPPEPQPKVDPDAKAGDPTVGGMMWFN